ncbi:TetR/AcrR family transcriptional regulator [Sphingomonas oligophenolica]|uniref:Helix-turn-helix domain-containing protein n=1 Tax=Sphingomonas oligophenolica TaxID=301154 RepID=A0ABU9Y656_9SPHN
MSVFAAKGYESTSLADLEQAMGINRVSMYATFGNKEALFVKAMTRYTEVGSHRFLHYLAAPSARQGFETLLRESVAMFTDPQGHGVCFVTQAPLTGANISAQTKRFVAERRAGIELMLCRRLRQALDEGELAPGTPIEDLARFFATTILGLALQAQHGATQSELLHVAEIAMRTWPPARRRLRKSNTTSAHAVTARIAAAR